MKVNYFTFLSFLFFLTSSGTKAQLVSCNAFLQGNHAELGINWMGAYGSTVAAPSGYHPQGISGLNLYNGTSCGSGMTTSSSFLGFVADPNFTNWTAYFGDYYMPGSPQEGWALEIKGHSVLAYTPTAQTTDSIPQLTGGNISYSATATQQTSTWEGVFDSVQVTQVTTIDTGALFFTVDVTLTNLSVFGRDSVYYMRTIDPDNDEAVAGAAGFSTLNRIDHQMPGGSDSLVSVSATGTIYSVAQIALATKDYRAHCFYMGAGLAPTYSLKDIYNDSTTYYHTVGDSSAHDVGIGLVFNIGHLATVDSAADSVTNRTRLRHPANSSSVKFIYSFEAGKVAHYLNADGGVVGDTSHLGISNTGSGDAADIKIFPNPSTDAFHITGLKNGQYIEVYELTGRLLKDKIPAQLPSGGAVVADLPQGNYILVVKQANGTIYQRKLIVKN